MLQIQASVGEVGGRCSSASGWQIAFHLPDFTQLWAPCPGAKCIIKLNINGRILMAAPPAGTRIALLLTVGNPAFPSRVPGGNRCAAVWGVQDGLSEQG